jgi:hypothetical protein
MLRIKIQPQSLIPDDANANCKCQTWHIFFPNPDIKTRDKLCHCTKIMLAENYEALFGQIAKASCAKSQAKATV